jgi:hypothetical protein
MNPQDNMEIQPAEDQLVEVPPVENESVEPQPAVRVPPAEVGEEPIDIKPISPIASAPATTEGTQGEQILEITRDTTENSNILNRICINPTTQVISSTLFLISGSSLLLRSRS